MRHFFAALGFLTVLPVPGGKTTPTDMKGAVFFFPVIGVLLGFLTGGCAWLAYTFLPPWPAALIVIAFLLILTGGLHMDGLGDTADGFFSARPRERILTIMRDSHIGAMGVMAIVLVLLAKITAFASMDREAAMRAAFLMPVAGRAFLIIMMAVLPYARPEGGMGSLFYSKSIKTAAVITLIMLLGACWLVAGGRGLAAVVVATAIILLFCVFCRRKIGGATGDTLGAGCELGEAALALAFVTNSAL